jgi:hypothetical protein
MTNWSISTNDKLEHKFQRLRGISEPLALLLRETHKPSVVAKKKAKVDFTTLRDQFVSKP